MYMSDKPPIGYISDDGLYLLQTGGRPFISPKPTKKLTIPVYAGSLVDIQNAELEIQEAYEKGREDMKQSFMQLVVKQMS